MSTTFFSSEKALVRTPWERSRGARIALWAGQIVAAGIFLMTGGSKLAGVPMTVATFDKLGAGPWLRYVTGAIAWARRDQFSAASRALRRLAKRTSGASRPPEGVV